MAKRANNFVKNAATDLIAGYFGNGKLRIYTGAQPASGNDAASGTLLVEITLPATPFAASSNGTAAKSGTWAAAAGASGTAGWFRMISSDTNKNIDGSVTATGGGGDLEIQNTSVNSGQNVDVTAFNLTALSGA